jgi:hypothetical protein
MKYKKSICLWFLLALHLIVMVSALPNLISAQESGQASGKDKPAAQDASRSADSTDATPATPLGLVWSDSYIRRIGTSGVLAGNRQGIGWGRLYIPSAGVIGIVDKFEGTSTRPWTTLATAVLQTTVVYDHRINGGSRIAVQYQPSIAIAEGQVVANFSNQNTSLNVLIYARPRWNVQFSDDFRYYYTQQSFRLPYFDVNPVTGGTVANTFLDGPSRWLSNMGSLSVAYALSARSSILVAPNYTYSESGASGNLERGASYGGSVRWDYRASERQTVGIQYIGELIRVTSPMTSGTTLGPTIDTVFQTIAGTAGRQLTATWFVKGAFGATTSAVSASQRQWVPYGTFGLLKRLGQSYLGIDYSREDTLFAGLISNQFADHVDLTYQHQMYKRWAWGVGGGYLWQVQSGGVSAWYTSSTAQFLLAPRAGLFATFDYAHKKQIAATSHLFRGTRDTFSFGILWQPGKVQH